MAIRLKPLSEQVVVITGASSGIGLAAAQMAADRGAKVVLVARNGEALSEILVGINNAGGRATMVEADIADDDAAERIAAHAIDTFGGFDTWVNNAAAAIYARLEDVSLAEHRRVFDVGYFGLVQGSLEAARHFKTRFAAAGKDGSAKDGIGGAIINVGSVLSDRAVPIQGAYSAMKHAVRGFTTALRLELEAAGAPVSVTLVKPGAMDTPYPEHARNKMDKPARVPPVVYDPRLSAKAILFAAEHPKRNLMVGGGGLPIKLSNLMPWAADKGMEALGDEKMQTTDTPPAPGTSDNLFEERADGRIDSNQDNAVRRTSLYLEAQMRPVAATAIISGAVAVAAGAIAYVNKRRQNSTMQAALTAKELRERLPNSMASPEPEAAFAPMPPVGIIDALASDGPLIGTVATPAVEREADVEAHPS